MNDRKAYKLEWQRKARMEFKVKRGYSTTCNYGAGKMREAVLIRDGFACVKCKMSDDEHKAKWGRPITIDHKDKNRKNNAMDNLQTLCLVCHSAKDGQTQACRVPHFHVFKDGILALRKQGANYEDLADQFCVSIGTAWKWIKRWEQQGTK